jgi:tRNA/tmRNA/rRNA uracil-C5-methylase (TrmA/RlmC/RlmD family)
VPYEEQVRAKERALRDLLGREVPVEPSGEPFGYRTRMDYVFAWGKLGLRKRGDPRGVLDLEECPILPDRAFDAVRKAKEAIHRLGLKPYSYVAHKGYLRYVVVRAAPRTGETMLVFLTNGPDPAVRALLDEAEAWADSVVWSVTERTADVSFGEVREHRKRDWIEEQVGDLRLRFGPNSFFQANPWVAGKLYGHVAERALGRVTDLFCGVGGIALSVAAAAAGRVEAVAGADSSEESIAFARGNAAANGLDRVRFEVADARDFLEGHACDTLVLDPPRAGLGGKTLRRVLAAAPRRVLYVACNPRKLAEELPQFAGFTLSDLRGFDLFPQTPHVEVVATLDRNEPS